MKHASYWHPHVENKASRWFLIVSFELLSKLWDGNIIKMNEHDDILLIILDILDNNSSLHNVKICAWLCVDSQYEFSHNLKYGL